MRIKKSAQIIMMSGGLVAVSADTLAAPSMPELYGIVDIGLEYYSDGDGTGNEIFQGFNSVAGNSDDREFTLSNGFQTRLGIKGSEKLDYYNLTASYKIELAVDVLNETGGGANGGDVGTRLGWAALSGDWGMLKIGSQWQALYEFGGWNTHRTDTHGYGTYYYTTSVLSNSQQYGFRQDSAISYQYGSAWGHSDPFAFNLTFGIGEGEFGGQQNRAGITSMQIAGQYSFNNEISVNAVYVTEFNDYAAGGAANNEPSLINIGGRWTISKEFGLGINYTTVDKDNAADESRDSFDIASFFDFGDGLTGHLGFGNGSDDASTKATTTVSDINLNTFGYIKKALSDRTSIRFEFENIQYDDVEDSNASLLMLALQHSF